MTTTPTVEESAAGVSAAPPDRVVPPRRRWPYVLALTLVLGLVTAAGGVLYLTPLLGVRQVEVTEGSGPLGAEVREAVIAAADLRPGTPLMSIDVGSVRGRVLAVPQVAAAGVVLRWPHDVLITVTQREPVAVTSANGALWLLDRTGLPYLKVAGTTPPPGLLTVALATPGPADPATRAALEVITQLTAGTRASVTSISARSPYNVVLSLADGRTVIWGSPDQGARKMQILPALLVQPGRVFDVSDPTYVTAR